MFLFLMTIWLYVLWMARNWSRECLHNSRTRLLPQLTDKLFNVVTERARVGGDAVFLQMGGDIRKGDRVCFVRGLPKVFEQDERAVYEQHISSYIVKRSLMLIRSFSAI